MARLPAKVSESFMKRNPGLFAPAITAAAQEERGRELTDVVTLDERDLHDDLERWLRVHEPPVPYVHAATHRKSTIQVGHPDFTVLYHGVACVEFKVEGGKLSHDQERVIAHLQSVGIPVKVCYSFTEAIHFLREVLGL